MARNDALARFRLAQDRTESGFADALSELRASQKRGHWIWYVFPQLLGLGSSAAATEYGLRGVDEAREYFAEPALRQRLLVATRAVAEQLNRGVPLRALMGSPIDALKLVSCLTLFEGVAEQARDARSPDDAEWLQLVTEVLAQAETQGLVRCPFTLRRLREASPQKVL